MLCSCSYQLSQESIQHFPVAHPFVSISDLKLVKEIANLQIYILIKADLKIYSAYLNWQSNEIFDIQVLHNSNLLGPLANRLKCFWFRFRWIIRFLSFVKKTDHGSRLRGDWLPRESDPPGDWLPSESDPLRRLTPQWIRPQGEWLPRESDPQGDWLPRESDPPWRLTHRQKLVLLLILRGVRFSKKRRILNQTWIFFNTMVNCLLGGSCGFDFWKKEKNGSGKNRTVPLEERCNKLCLSKVTMIFIQVNYNLELS